jgi:hypothetical protein
LAIGMLFRPATQLFAQDFSVAASCDAAVPGPIQASIRALSAISKIYTTKSSYDNNSLWRKINTRQHTFGLGVATIHEEYRR